MRPLTVDQTSLSLRQLRESLPERLATLGSKQFFGTSTRTGKDGTTKAVSSQPEPNFPSQRKSRLANPSYCFCGARNLTSGPAANRALDAFKTLSRMFLRSTESLKESVSWGLTIRSSRDRFAARLSAVTRTTPPCRAAVRLNSGVSPQPGNRVASQEQSVLAKAKAPERFTAFEGRATLRPSATDHPDALRAALASGKRAPTRVRRGGTQSRSRHQAPRTRLRAREGLRL